MTVRTMEAESGEALILRRRISLASPFRVAHLPLLSRLHRAAFRHRRRLSKRFVGKPAKRLFLLLRALGLGGQGGCRLALPQGERTIAFNARNTQFGALYLPQNLPIYEPETSALLLALSKPDGVFLDVGANWGWYALLLASQPGFSGQVHAFEPFPPTFADLTSVVRQAGLETRIHCHEMALAQSSGQGSMAFSDGIQSGLARLGAEGGVRVPMAALDDLELPVPDLIKIDAEDHEFDVLLGAEATITKHKPFIVFENWLHRDNPPLTLDPLQWLAARGFVFFHAGWAGSSPDCVVSQHPGGAEAELVLLPLLPAQRFMLPSQLNVLAVSRDRLGELAARFQTEVP